MAQLTLQQGIEAVLKYAMLCLKEDHTPVECIVDCIDASVIPELLNVSDKDYKTMFNYNGAKWEKLFKEHFGHTEDQYLDQQHQAYMAAFTEKERKLYKEMESVCTSRLLLELRDGVPTLRGTYYYSSPKKLAFMPESNHIPGVSFTDKWIGDYGFTLAEVEEFLKRLNVTKGKRPKQKRSYSYTMYD